MKLEKTLAIIKPDGIKNIDKIIEMFYVNELQIVNYKLVKLNKEILKEHYAHLIDKPFYKSLEEYMLSGYVAIIILEGQNAVNKLRDIMGATDSKKADKNTIRGMYGTDITYNAIHGSDSLESAKIEIERFFSDDIKVKKLIQK